MDTVSGYIHFCEQTVVTSKTVKCFPNNKPWVTKEIKDKLIQKRKFLQSHNRIEQKIIQKELDKEIKNCKNVYKAKLVRNFESGNSREAWRGLQAITGYKRKPNVTLSSDPRELCDNLNQFYARLDVDIPHENINHLKETLPRDENFSIDHKDVVKLFAGLNVRKASGVILKNCADQLAGVYKNLFEAGVRTNIPSIWKSATIIPVPKNAKAKELNDFRPVALTYVPFKCLERIILKNLLLQTEPKLDNYQFAYRKGRCTDDAILTHVNTVIEHLEKSN